MRARAAGGRVVLVGAGLGDPDLLTVRAWRALESADVVFYDALIDPRLLDLAPKAQRFCVGKRAGAPSMAQETIHAVMIRAARAGRSVVRLKSGDPFVLGRGGEEVLALGEAGVPVEVIPGVSSAIAGPAAAGIPVTHRGIASGFLVISAVPEAAFAHTVATLRHEGLTLVVLMALGARGAIVRELTQAGWPAEHPTALVMGAHSHSPVQQWSWTGRLEQLAAVEPPDDRLGLPALVVVGGVVAVGEAMRAYLPSTLESGPLADAREEKRRDYA